MKRGLLVLLFLIWGLTREAGGSVAADSQLENEPEDYKLLQNIITTEFAGQVPHEWGDSVSGVKLRLKTDEKVLALGVDACGLMGKGEDAKLIRFFEKENIPATLFFCGDWVDKNPTILKRLAANPLFEIANQGVSSKACSVNGKMAEGAPGTRDIKDLFTEIEKNARKIESITGILPQYFHAGGAGYYDEVAVRIIKALGYEALGSSVHLPRGRGLEKKQAVEVLMSPSAGAIAILGGDPLQSFVADTVIETVHKLRSQGYKFVKVSDYLLE